MTGRHRKSRPHVEWPSFRECMGGPLREVWGKHTKSYRNLTRPRFGDQALKPARLTPKVAVRLVLALPVGVIGTVLCVTVIGLPLGLPLLLATGAWITKPIRKHPMFNPSDPGLDDVPPVDDYEIGNADEGNN